MWRHWCFGDAGEGIVVKVPVLLMVVIEEALVVLVLMVVAVEVLVEVLA